FLTKDMLFGPDDPLFPATHVEQSAAHQFEAVGLSRAHWSNATPIRKIFREAFTTAKLPYFNPHSFRRTLAELGERLCRTPEQFKAWSQNLGHEDVLTTLSSYGQVNHSRQAELIRQLGSANQPPQIERAVDEAMRALQEVIHRAYPERPDGVSVSQKRQED